MPPLLAIDQAQLDWILFSVLLASGLILYIMVSYPLERIMKERNIKGGFFAFVPVFRWFQVLRVGDNIRREYQYSAQLRARFLFCFFFAVLGLVYTRYNIFLLSDFWIKSIFVFSCVILICALWQLLLALYYIYQRHCPEKARIFLVITILCPISISIFFVYIQSRLAVFYK